MSTPRRKLLLGFVLLLALGSVAYHWYHRTVLEMKAKTAAKAAYAIHQCWFAYASSHDDNFPTAQHDSNEAMRELFRGGLVDDEKPFWVSGSAWCGPGAKPDGIIGDVANRFAQALSAGENHWACTAGLNTKLDATIPLIMDGFTETVGQWCDDPKRKGGVWEGRYAVVVRMGGNAQVISLPPEMSLNMPEYSDGSGPTLREQVDRVPGARLLNPLQPVGAPGARP